MAGGDHDALTSRIRAYEEAVDAGNQKLAEARFLEITAQLEAPETTGEVARIVNRAKSYEFEVESTLGQEARRFADLLPSFRKQPELVVKRKWFETFAKVLNSQTSEVFWVPDDLAAMQLKISGLDEVAERRRLGALKRKEQEHLQQFANPMVGKIIRAEDLADDRPRRRLQVDEETGALGGGGSK